jgi:hypothetical protein
MSAYNPPSEFITEFNTSLFNQPEQILSQTEADKLYLSKKNSDTSTAGSTTFNGAVSVGGNITGSSLIQSNTTSASTNSIYNNLFTGSTLAIGTANSNNAINGETTFNNLANISTSLYVKSGSSTTNYTELNQTNEAFTFANKSISGSMSMFCKTAGGVQQGMLLTAASLEFNTNTFLKCRQLKSSTTAGAHTLFDDMTTGGTLTIGNALSTNTINGATNFSNRLNFSAATYSFPFASNTSLGYYLKTTGTGTAVTSATPKSIVTMASIPVGVWRIDFSVQNVVGAAGAGTITQAQSYISTTLDGAVATAVSFTGSIIRSHVSEVYANNDVQVINSSITYNQSTAGVLYLNIVRVFATGTYSFTGEIGLTRLA